MQRIMRMPAVTAALGDVCPATIYNWVNLGLLPKPVKIGPRASGWFEEDIAARQAEIMAQRDAPAAA